MRAPNGQGCGICSDLDFAIANVGDVVGRCGEQLASAVNDGSAIEFRILPNERQALERLFPEQSTTGERLMALINTAMKRRGISYELTEVRMLTPLSFAFRVAHYRAPVSRTV